MSNAPQWTSDRDNFLSPTGRKGYVSAETMRGLTDNRLMSVSEYNSSGYGREDALQIECVKWFRKAYPKLKMLLVASLNGAELQDRDNQWPHLVKQGAVVGDPDLTLQVPSGDFGCLHLEMKTLTGTQRPSQRRFQLATEAAGNAYVLPRSLAQFKRAVTTYLDGKMVIE